MGEAVWSSEDVVRGWRFKKGRQPRIGDLDTVAEFLGVDKMEFLVKISSRNKEWLCVEKFMSVKRISDAMLAYFQLFKKTEGFEKCHVIPEIKARCESYSVSDNEYMVSYQCCMECLERVELVLSQERILLEGTKTYERLKEFYFDVLYKWAESYKWDDEFGFSIDQDMRDFMRSCVFSKDDENVSLAAQNASPCSWVNLYNNKLSEILYDVGFEPDKKDQKNND